MKRSIALALTLLFAPPALAEGPSLDGSDLAPSHPKVDPRIWSGFDEGSSQVVLVEVADPLGSDRVPAPGARREASTLQREEDLARRKKRIVASLRAMGRSSQPRRDLPHFRLFSIALDRAEVRALAGHPEVERIHFNRLAVPLLKSSAPFTGAPPLNALGFDGEGTSVAVLDSPVRYDNGYFGTCPEPGAPDCSVAARVNFSPDPIEDVAKGEAHGTNVAGIVLGVAPRAKILSLNVFHWYAPARRYVSTIEEEIAALDWVVENRARYAIVAVNMSLGSDRTNPEPCNWDPLYEPLRTLWTEHGILAAIASGNSGQQNAVGSPACVSSAVTVGAQYDTDLDPMEGGCYREKSVRRGQLACFSDSNGLVDLVAPGVDIDAGGLKGYSGTSMAAPHVAGAMAALQSGERARTGRFLDAAALHKRMLFAAVPRPADGRTFAQLRLDESAGFAEARAFPSWFRQAPENAIPKSSERLALKLEVDGLGKRAQGPYLYLEIAHGKPQDVLVTLTAPSGKQARVRLPAGQANFTGILGRLVSPGAFSELAGPADGTWVLGLEDAGDGGGSYLSAALLFAPESCSPACPAERCGDDGCGGTCGACRIADTCVVAGQRAPGSECRICDPARNAALWTNYDGMPCDDGNACTFADRCAGGTCGGTLISCPAPDGCHTENFCDPNSGRCHPAKPRSGNVCDDGDICTVRDTCEVGRCISGAALACPEPPECWLSEGCHPVLGCRSSPAPDGTPCAGGACRDGACTSSCGCASGLGAGTGAALLGLSALLRRVRRSRPT